MSHVTLENVRKVYDRSVVAVHGFSLQIADGEFVVLVGPSGCGKSTTLRMIAGLEEITGGTISIGGRVVNRVHPKDRDIAMVFQNYALYPHMTVYKNMAFGLSLRRVPRAEIRRQVERTARLLGIDHLLDRRPRALSGGQRQRVALGRAIVREPKVFLFDEPLSNLDAKLRATTRTELKKLHARLKTTTVYVTHDQTEAMTLGDRVVVMSDGHIQQVDTPLGVFSRPANRFVGSFVGSAPMNFLDGRLAQRDGAAWFDAGDLGVRVRLDPAPGLADRNGQQVVLGWRPTAFREAPGPEDPAPGRSMRLKVAVVEPLGQEVDLSCEIAGAASGPEILARIPAREGLAPGQELGFGLDMDHVHVFEPGEFGRNLLHPPV